MMTAVCLKDGMRRQISCKSRLGTSALRLAGVGAFDGQSALNGRFTGIAALLQLCAIHKTWNLAAAPRRWSLPLGHRRIYV